MTTNKFKLNHVALYAKNWYKQSSKSTIFDDLKKCLTCDNYNGEFMTNNDVIYIILNHCQKIKTHNFSNLVEILNGVSKENCWRYGYYTKDNYPYYTNKDGILPEYDYHTAILMYCMSCLRTTTKEDLGIETLLSPDYKNCLPRRNGITDEKLKSQFGDIKCTSCNKCNSSELHTCPKKMDLDADYDSLCDCCLDCVTICKEEI